MGMIAGFNFTKISAERSDLIKGKVDINNNVSIKNVEETDLSLGKQKQKALKFTFEFTSKYEPSFGAIILEGDILFLDDPKAVKDIMASWQKDKKIPKEIMLGLLNTVLAKCNVQALILSQEINMPPPIPMPNVSAQAQEKAEKKEYIG
ncbi:hypothetical protein HYT54_00270 [Candidatus Woesearchaeota archaeon]|nr:hypothetical protein [Candidatus Woesearchaeota archaeon]